MPLRDWGLGLEALTECYFKYVLGYIVERGRAYQIEREIKHKGRKFVVPYPAEVDLIAIYPGRREIALITCKEYLDLKTVNETLNQFVWHLQATKEILGFKDEAIDKWAAYVKATQSAKDILDANNFYHIDASEMIKTLIEYHRKMNPKRKGVLREPIFWLLQTLDKEGLLKSETDT